VRYQTPREFATCWRAEQAKKAGANKPVGT
jgi:hypothetical protein